MVRTAASVEWTVVSTEVEALQLEYSWIKEFDPRFNVRYRDDKSYPWLAVTLDEEFPRAQVMRGAKRKGVKYFGPYAHAWAIRETLDLLLRVFPMRTCRQRGLQAGRPGRPAVPARLHRQVLARRASAGSTPTSTADRRGLLRLHGRARPQRYLKRLEREMRDASRRAGVRTRGPAARRHRRAQPGDGEAGGRARRRHRRRRRRVRRGRARGGRAGVLRARRPGARPARLGRRQGRGDRHRRVSSSSSCTQALRLDESARRQKCRARCCVPALPDDEDVVTELLESVRGGKVSCGCRSAATSVRCMETVERNAKEAFARHKLEALQRPHPAVARAAGAAGRARAARGAVADRVLRRVEPAGRRRGRVDGRLRGRPAPARASTAGSRSEASQGQDDVAAINEVISRRFRRYLEERVETGELDSDLDADERPQPIDPVTGKAEEVRLSAAAGRRRRRAAAGRGRRRRAATSSASTTSRSAGWPSGSRRCGCPDRADPVILPRTSEALYLLQRVRDEAHRFAITYHRQRRSKSMTVSALDDVPGLGETRRKALLRTSARSSGCGRPASTRSPRCPASAGVPPRRSHAALAAQAAPAPAVDPATGEIIEDTPAGRAVSVPADTGAVASGRLGASPMSAPTTRIPPPSTSSSSPGMSGAGRSTAAKCLEDLGWFVVDNLPPVAARRRWSSSRPLAGLGRPDRGRRRRTQPRHSPPTCTRRWPSSTARACAPRVLFLEASDEALVRRFESVRRPHPLQGGGPLDRRHRPRARAAARPARRRRPRHRHQRPQRARAARQRSRRRSATRPRPACTPR